MTFRLSDFVPLNDYENLRELAIKIQEIHEIAYCWNTKSLVIEKEINQIILQPITTQDHTRQIIKRIVKLLDTHYDKLYEEY